MSNSAGLLLALVLAISIAIVAGLQCYQCNSYENNNCGHGADVDSGYLKNCTGANDIVCRKIVTYVDFDVNDNKHTERILRKCGFKESDYNEKCYYRGGLGGRQFVCSCKTEACNSGTSIGITMTVIITTFAALIFATFSL